ncbi:hypothetical protein TNIN_468861 [Trichonephila inaurata madagascariensis]|uniref:Uncharacterized protein n=1 Tax=Trichonephila inaurata madagascariensis TaxID=2747483 RepID=A0A8X7CU85_9ARAC|nr:hypothetical protein TNIN_468861 [Trichonephila inaurata madagascariensis]
MARCNAEGNFLPSYRIFKGKRKPEFEDAWNKAATVRNSTSGFSTTGIYPYNPQEIPQHAFSISDGSSNDTDVASISGACDMPTPAVASTSRVTAERA